MPIRFRCPHCSRLLGIARRKSGTQINCPQCSKLLTVPIDDADADLDEIDVLLNPVSSSIAMSPLPTRTEPPRAVIPAPLPPPPPTRTVEPERARIAPTPLPPPLPARSPEAERPRVAPPPPPPRPRPVPLPAPVVRPESSLLENDVDVLLGLEKPGAKFELDDEPPAKRQPVGGMDALSLGEDHGGLMLSPQKATLLAIAVLVLLGLAFAAGFIIASNT